MRLYIKYDIHAACRKILEEQLSKLELPHTMLGFGELEIPDGVPKEEIHKLSALLDTYGIQIVENQKSILVQKIKDVITELIYQEDKLPNVTVSSYLADKLKHSYGYLSNLFSEVTYSSIENFTILQRVERAKELITTSDLTFTEIAWKLNYSSVAHFSAQFKNVTGLTPTAFLRIINKRRDLQTQQ